MSLRTLCIAMLAAAALPAGGALAGPLSPPAGPVTPTHRTLTQVEPRTPVGPETTPGDDDYSPSVYKITQPGSYYLTGDVIGESGKHGIEITAQDVTLDLNGFTVRGVPGSLSGIVHTAQSRAVRVRNGFVEGWGSRGVMIAQGLVNGTNAVEDLTVRDCGSFGIELMGTAVRCIAANNGNIGFYLSGEGVVRDCLATGNGSQGYHLFGRFVVEGCVATLNEGEGFFAANGACHIRGCTAAHNAESGIYVAGSGSIIEGNLCRGNGTAIPDGAGIYVLNSISDVRVDSNHVTQNDYGIRVEGSSSFIIRNTARANAQNIVVSGVGNTYGPTVTTTGQIGTTSPWANFAN